MSKKIITDTMGFMKQRVQETKHKQSLVNMVNDSVGEEITLALAEEEAFYKSDDRDKLKTPPYVYVKRIPRPGVEQPTRQTAVRATSKKRSRSRGKSSEPLSHTTSKNITIAGVLG